MAKKLKEAGWPQGRPEFVWEVFKEEIGREPYLHHYLSGSFTNNKNRIAWFHAPTAEEILRRLPDRIEKRLLNVSKYEGNEWVVSFFDPADKYRPETYFNSPSLANAAAAMWVYLRENDLIDFENCDPRHHE